MHRRDFLRSSSLLACGLSVPTFLARTAAAAPNGDKPGAKDTILVVVQLTGGNDGMNTVIPFADPQYAKLRPTIGIPKAQVKKINDQVGLHPAMDGFSKLLEEQAFCVVQGVGYPNPTQSHFRSMDIWQAASTAETLTEGWIGKALKSKACGAFHVAGGNESAPLALSGAPARVPSITSLEDFQLRTAGASPTDSRNQKAVIEGAAKGANDPGLLDFVRKTALNTYSSSQRLREVAANYQPKANYPQTGLANRLKLAAQLIDADLGARIFYVSQDGYDTHASQGGVAGAHATLLAELSGAVTAFYQDLAARGHKDRVLILTFSEFGRRPYENGSKGTDHGAAAPVFLVGGKVVPGAVGSHPSLTDHQFGNLKFHTDFRGIYATILDQWLGVPSREVLGTAFKPVSILRA
jgi:uncharacterized protein (DUF1501 family)